VEKVPAVEARADSRYRSGRIPDRIKNKNQPSKGRLLVTVFVYVNTSKQVGDAEHIKVFATTDAAEKWFEENDPEGVAFEYEVLE
jgi:hypothetical protein